VPAVLEHLLRVGRLPLRRSGIAALEVGAGPAPALYAIRDFYEDLVRWPARGDWATGPLRVCDALDKAPGWDRFLHRLSEALIAERHTGQEDGQLPFGRVFADFTGLDVRAVHHASVASLAASIEAEFDQAGEPVSRATASRFAYEQGTGRPSAYDLVFVPNFLTRADALQLFQAELRGLMRSLTPGGVFAALCGTGGQYIEIRSGLEALAASSGLTAVGPSDPVEANAGTMRRAIVAGQVRAAVSEIMDACSPEQREPFRRLPPELTDAAIAFSLPKFMALAFVSQGRPRRSRNTIGRG